MYHAGAFLPLLTSRVTGFLTKILELSTVIWWDESMPDSYQAQRINETFMIGVSSLHGPSNVPTNT